MYCEDSYGTDLDHYRPRSLFPEMAFVWPNLILACSRCNAQGKAGNFPMDGAGAAMVVNPTTEDPADHLVLLVEFGRYKARTPKGAETIKCLRLNRGELEEGRFCQWIALKSQLRDYDALRDGRRDTEADEVATTLRLMSFSIVLQEVLRIYSRPFADRLLGVEIVNVLDKRPELRTLL